jgi:hypothetical protein
MDEKTLPKVEMPNKTASSGKAGLSARPEMARAGIERLT